MAPPPEIFVHQETGLLYVVDGGGDHIYKNPITFEPLTKETSGDGTVIYPDPQLEGFYISLTGELYKPDKTKVADDQKRTVSAGDTELHGTYYKVGEEEEDCLCVKIDGYKRVFCWLDTSDIPTKANPDETKKIVLIQKPSINKWVSASNGKILKEQYYDFSKTTAIQFNETMGLPVETDLENDSAGTGKPLNPFTLQAITATSGKFPDPRTGLFLDVGGKLYDSDTSATALTKTAVLGISEHVIQYPGVEGLFIKRGDRDGVHRVYKKSSAGNTVDEVVPDIAVLAKNPANDVQMLDLSNGKAAFIEREGYNDKGILDNEIIRFDRKIGLPMQVSDINNKRHIPLNPTTHTPLTLTTKNGKDVFQDPISGFWMTTEGDVLKANKTDPADKVEITPVTGAIQVFEVGTTDIHMKFAEGKREFYAESTPSGTYEKMDLMLIVSAQLPATDSEKWNIAARSQIVEPGGCSATDYIYEKHTATGLLMDNNRRLVDPITFRRLTADSTISGTYPDPMSGLLIDVLGKLYLPGSASGTKGAEEVTDTRTGLTVKNEGGKRTFTDKSNMNLTAGFKFIVKNKPFHVEVDSEAPKALFTESVGLDASGKLESPVRVHSKPLGLPVEFSQTNPEGAPMNILTMEALESVPGKDNVKLYVDMKTGHFIDMKGDLYSNKDRKELKKATDVEGDSFYVDPRYDDVYIRNKKDGKREFYGEDTSTAQKDETTGHNRFYEETKKKPRKFEQGTGVFFKDQAGETRLASQSSKGITLNPSGNDKEDNFDYPKAATNGLWNAGISNGTVLGFNIMTLFQLIQKGGKLPIPAIALAAAGILCQLAIAGSHVALGTVLKLKKPDGKANDGGESGDKKKQKEKAEKNNKTAGQLTHATTGLAVGAGLLSLIAAILLIFT